MRSRVFGRPYLCRHEKNTRLRRFDGHAVATHEHALIDHHLENAQGTRLVQATFVAADRGHIGRVLER